jgi:prevent-host-death family protein
VTEIINVHQAKTHLSKLLDKAHGGEEIVLSKAGKPYAKLVPLEKPKRKLGFIKGHLDDGFFDPLPEAELSVSESQ